MMIKFFCYSCWCGIESNDVLMITWHFLSILQHFFHNFKLWRIEIQFFSISQHFEFVFFPIPSKTINFLSITPKPQYLNALPLSTPLRISSSSPSHYSQGPCLNFLCTIVEANSSHRDFIFLPLHPFIHFLKAFFFFVLQRWTHRSLGKERKA